MPATCIVCGATKKTDNVKLFHFAVISQKVGHFQEIAKRRRHEWLRVVLKTEEDLKQTGTGHYVCSRHFKSGEPAKVQDVTDPDWIPSQNLIATINRTTTVRKNKKNHPASEKNDQPAAKYKKTNADSSRAMDSELKKQSAAEVVLNEEETIAQLKETIQQKDIILHRIQVQLRHHEVNEKSFVDNDLKTQFYTGFVTYKCFAAFASTVAGLLPQSGFPGITKTNILIMVMTKLRLNLPLAYMSLKFEIPFETLTNLFTSSVTQLADKLKVTWPGTRKIPKFLANIFGDQLAAIVDIIELELDFGSGTFQSIKFLIAYAPCGRISFVSKAFTGVSNDNWIINDSGLLKQLKANDLVLALRGTLSEEVTVPGSTRDRVFMYGLGSHGLVQLPWNHASASELRTNLRAVMDQLTMVFGFLAHKQPEMWMKDPITFLSKAIMLCAALRNLILPV